MRAAEARSWPTAWSGSGAGSGSAHSRRFSDGSENRRRRWTVGSGAGAQLTKECVPPAVGLSCRGASAREEITRAELLEQEPAGNGDRRQLWIPTAVAQLTQLFEPQQ